MISPDDHASIPYYFSPVLMLSNSIADLCNNTSLQCQNWNSWVPSALSDTGIWSKMGHMSESFPETLSYESFLESTEAEHSIGSVWSYAFQTPSTDLSVVTTPPAMVVLIVLVLILRAVKRVLLPYFSNIGRRAGRQTHGVEWELKNEDRIVKFGEYTFRLLYHATVSAVGIWYFWDKVWLDSSRGGTKNLFNNYPRDQVDVGMTWYYLVQCAYNLDALLSLVELSFAVKFESPVSKTGALVNPISIGWSKTVRGDFREMAIHHVLTNLLVIGSSHCRLTRIGSMVFMVHDISDVPVDLSKLSNFLKWKKATIASFVSMVLLWLVLRLGALPLAIYRPCASEGWTATKDVDPLLYHVYYPFFLRLLEVLILLHTSWFCMFLKMGWLLVSKGERHDLSEHKSGESQELKTTRASVGANI